MNHAIVDLWATVGSAAYWTELISRFPSDFVPFEERWPQPGFVGGQYLHSSPRIVLIGQNPRASKTPRSEKSDREMFRLIRQHAEIRTDESLRQLFQMTQDFMSGNAPYTPAWRPITAARKHLGLSLDSIAYLNLIPLATDGDRILPAFAEAYALSTEKQIDLLKPAKIVMFGKGAYKRFCDLSGRSSDTRYIEQRNYSHAPGVKAWLAGG